MDTCGVVGICHEIALLWVVPIQNQGELETVIHEVIIQLDKRIHAFGATPKMEGGRRTLVEVRDTLKRKDPLGPLLVQKLNTAAAILRETLKDNRVDDLMWDVTDYIELHMKP